MEERAQYGFRPGEENSSWTKIEEWGQAGPAGELHEKNFGDVVFYLEGSPDAGWVLSAEQASPVRELGEVCRFLSTPADAALSAADEQIAGNIAAVRCAVDYDVDLDEGRSLSTSAFLDYDVDRLRDEYIEHGASPLLAELAAASAESSNDGMYFFDSSDDFPEGTTQADLDALSDEISSLGLGLVFEGSFNLEDDADIVICYGAAWHETADALAKRENACQAHDERAVKPSFKERSESAMKAAEHGEPSSAEKDARAADIER